MKRLSSLVVACALPLVELPATPLLPPPIVSTGPAAQLMLAWLPGEARCDGEALAPVMMRRPYLALSWKMPAGDASPTVTYRFRIDATGRPLSIARQGQAYAPFSEDIGPSLATSRFAGDAEKHDCTITYVARQTPLAEAPVEDLVSYTIMPNAGRLPQVGLNRVKSEGATCFDEPRRHCQSKGDRPSGREFSLVQPRF